MPDELTVLRALGSGVRQSILEMLSRGPATSAMIAREMSSNTGVTSYHLRELGKAGLIEPDRQVGRSLYWRRSRADVIFDEAQVSQSPAAARSAGDMMVARFNASLEHFLRREDLEPEWHRSALLSQAAARLTPDELAEFAGEYLTLLKRWSARVSADPRARPVRIALFAYPDRNPLAEEGSD
ncbi:MAG TPA: winged helix-turn-helix domain-containing protein, partial [Micromonosporaceae bacterium]